MSRFHPLLKWVASLFDTGAHFFLLLSIHPWLCGLDSLCCILEGAGLFVVPFHTVKYPRATFFANGGLFMHQETERKILFPW